MKKILIFLKMFSGLYLWFTNVLVLLSCDYFLRILKKKEIETLISENVITLSCKKEFFVGVIKSGFPSTLFNIIICILSLISVYFIYNTTLTIKHRIFKVLFVILNLLMGFLYYVLLILYYGIETGIDSL